MHEVASDNEPPRIVRAGPLSVRRVAHSWLEHKATDCAASTLRTYRRDIDRIGGRLGDTMVGSPSQAHVVASPGRSQGGSATTSRSMMKRLESKWPGRTNLNGGSCSIGRRTPELLLFA